VTETGGTAPPQASGKKKKAKNTKAGNAPKSFDLAAEMKRVRGVDAFGIDGVSVMTIQTVVAGRGTGRQKSWPSAQAGCGTHQSRNSPHSEAAT